MRYSVEISKLAEDQYEKILEYLSNVKKNSQAVNGVIEDFDYAVDQLEGRIIWRDNKKRAYLLNPIDFNGGLGYTLIRCFLFTGFLCPF